MGHLGRQTKTQAKYDHTDLELCHEVREKIDRGDAILNRALQKPGGDLPEPYEIAFNQYQIKLMQELMKTNKSGLIEKRGNDFVIGFEKTLERASASFPDTEQWLEEKIKVEEFNKPREDYKHKYGIYPEDDIVMQAWMNNPTASVDKDRAKAYAICRLNATYYQKEKELAEHFGIRHKKVSK
jgi:hypothetical protein